MMSSADQNCVSKTPSFLHTKCRAEEYPREGHKRFAVPDYKVPWSVPFDGYNPESITLKSVLGKPWADPDYEKEPAPDSIWNKVDETNKIDRKSHEGIYSICEKYKVPLNPFGRTGLRGRGCLGRWGPNQAADPIVTRWKKENGVNPVTGKKILQFVSIQRRDTKDWAFPGGMVDPGELITSTLRREFQEEALNTLEMNDYQKSNLKGKIDKVFQNGVKIYEGYVDDPRNTDNAWMETLAYNFHDAAGDGVGRLRLHAGDDACNVQWMDVDKDINLYASHKRLIEQVVKRLNAHW